MPYFCGPVHSGKGGDVAVGGGIVLELLLFGSMAHKWLVLQRPQRKADLVEAERSVRLVAHRTERHRGV